MDDLKKIQNKFILIARNIDSNCNSLIDKLNCISSLVIIFLHFKDKLDIMDINILESMSCFFNIFIQFWIYRLNCKAKPQLCCRGFVVFSYPR